MSAPETPIHGEYVDKWFAREPEMRLAEVFVPAAWRSRHRLWGALLNELREAAFELSEPLVAVAKVGWWSDELVALAGGHARHPLTAALPVTAPWVGAARALSAMLADVPRPADTESAFAGLRPLASALIAIESALFEIESGAEAVDALIVHLLSERLDAGPGADDGARIPMSVLARYGVGQAELAADPRHPALRAWAAELLAHAPAALSEAALLRRQRTAFDLGRLRALRAGRGRCRPTGPMDLLRAWRASRRPPPSP